MKITDFTDYRDLIKETILFCKRKLGQHYTIGNLAKSMRIQRTYLSSVLNGKKGHLNSDQLYLAATFLKLSEEKYEFLKLLYEYNRSSVDSRRKVLSIQLEKMKTRLTSAQNYLKSVETPSGDLKLDEFYLDFNAQLIHMFLTVDRYAKSPDLIRKALHLSKEVFSQKLELLERLGLTDGLEVKKASLHLPSSSPLFSTYRNNMRTHAIARLASQSEENAYSFSVLFSSEDQAFQETKLRFMEFIEWAQANSQKYDPKEVFQINFDLLNWKIT